MNAQTQHYPNPITQQKTLRSRSAWVWAGLAILIMAVLPLVLLAAAAVYYKNSQRILPAVRSGAVSLGNLTLNDAATQLDLFWNQSPHFLLEIDGQNMAVTPASLGLWVDPSATAMQAYQIGRYQGGIGQIIQLLRGKTFEVHPVVRFDAQLARDALEDLSMVMGEPPKEEQLIQNAEGRWVAGESQSGSAFDVSSAIVLISANPDAILRQGKLQLGLISVLPQKNDLSGELQRIDGIYQKPLRMQAYDVIRNETFRWELPQNLVSSWVHLDDPQGIPSLVVVEEQFIYYLQTWQKDIGNLEIEEMADLTTIPQLWANGQPFQLKLRHKSSRYTVQPGDNLVGIGFKVGIPYWKIQEANPGISIIGVGPGQVLTIPSPNEMLPYPVVDNKRIVISISQQHMWTYENGELHSEHVISTGMDKSPTMPGVFQIQTHDLNAYAAKWDLWMPHFMGIYEAVPGFMNGIHGLPVLSNGQRLWGSVLGSKASYGCIIMDLQAAEDLYNWAENGVVVEIQP